MLNNNKLTGGGYREYKHCLVWKGMSSSEMHLSNGQVDVLLDNSNAWMLRNIYDWDCGRETNFWEIINDCPRRLEELPSKTRNQVRRCLKDCVVKRISKDTLICDDGYNVYAKSFERYKNVESKPDDRITWESKTRKSNGYEYWGVYEKESGTLIAWAMNSLKGDSVNYNTLKAIPEMMNKHYPYFGLLFEMNKYYLEEVGVKYVTDGFRSVSGHSNIQPFLEKNFLFRKAYCNMDIHYRPWLKFLITILFPFRNHIPNLAVQNVLRFEAINRGIQ